MPGPFQDLPDDVVIYMFDMVSIPDILSLRQTCKRMHKISGLRIVWTNACNHHILPPYYPFPNVQIEELTVPELEHCVRDAYSLASRWLSLNSISPGAYSDFDATNGTPVSDLRFVPGYDGNWLLAVSSGIWSIIALWELRDEGRTATKRWEWSRRNCTLRSFAMNDDQSSNALLALSVVRGSEPHVEILSLNVQTGFRSLGTIDSALNPVYFHGDILVLCDPIDVSIVTNWKTGASAVLRRPEDASPTDISLNDRCIRVIFSTGCILVIRARSLTLFPNPPLTKDPMTYAPLAVHSFGWVYGVGRNSNRRS
ncbi:hypothetical protein B0H16DRAFT_172886, partial [Mycena metata]